MPVTTLEIPNSAKLRISTAKKIFANRVRENARKLSSIGCKSGAIGGTGVMANPAAAQEQQG
jgi:hypothetical protein